jgi:hypothetical protein
VDVLRKKKSICGFLLVGVLLPPGTAMKANAAGLNSGATDRRAAFLDLRNWAGRSPENSVVHTAAKQCLSALASDDLTTASNKCNQALSLDIRSAPLQLLNGLVYHLQSMEGASEQAALAEQGYKLSLQFDPTNWVAHYFLGRLALEQRKFDEAQEEFANVLLFEPEDPDALLGLAVGAYYGGKPKASVAAIKQLERVTSARNLELTINALQVGALAYAASGEKTLALQWLGKAKRNCGSPANCGRLENRVKHWFAIHDAGRGTPGLPGDSANSPPIIARASALPATEQPLAVQDFSARQSGLLPPPSEPPKILSALLTQNLETSGSPPINNRVAELVDRPDCTLPTFKNGQLVAAGTGVATSQFRGRMVMLDVVIIKMEDTISTNKGVNLLSSLNFQFGSSTSSLPAFNRSVAGTAVTGGSASDTTSITRAISVPALTYSLNIANANSKINELLARPTIVAMDCTKSEFFSGTELNAAAVSGSALGMSQPIQVQKEIGVKLGVTPQFMNDSTVRLAIDVVRTFVTPASSDVNYTFKLETSKINTQSNVQLRFGETLILGGLSEKEYSKTRDGVPFLENIPGVQYFFSNQKTLDFQRSVLMLITPRDPYYTFQYSESAGNESQSSGGSANSKSTSLDRLRNRYGDWFEPYSTTESIFNHLGKTDLYREFRTGDVTLEKWDRQQSTYERLQQALNFIFY